MTPVERGARIAELRQATKLTQAEVGAVVGSTKQAVSEWERGVSNPDRRKLLKLDRVYKANGEVLELFDVGYDISRLDELEAQVDALWQVVRAIGAHTKMDVAALLAATPAAPKASPSRQPGRASP